MKPLLILILSLSFSIAAVGQDDSADTFNKAEAMNQTVNGKKEGKWIENFTVDEVKAVDTALHQPYYRLILYKAGIPYGMVYEYYPNGELYSKTKYVNGQKNGLARFYYRDGKLEEEIIYRDDIENGIDKLYYESGKLKSKTIYNNGVPGITKNYDENGNEFKK
ncbi:MAG TPA: hypothetical protein VK806_09635 [Bacteroidia bacterium]|jgi:hypothetical protein|nr:hypothetical protein [Bacteroidia bacterium]